MTLISKNRKTGTLALLAAGFMALPMVSQAVIADDISYTYVEVTGTLENPDRQFSFIGPADQNATTTAGDGYGASARVSLALPEFFPFLGFHIIGDYTQTNIDYDTVYRDGLGDISDLDTLIFSEDQNEWRLAAGAHVNLVDRVSVFAEVGVSGVDIGDLSGITDSGKTGLDARIGLRALISDNLEINGFARANPNGGFNVASLSEIGQSDFENAATFDVGLAYRLLPGFRLVADYEFGDTVNRLRAGIRFSF